MRKPGSAKTRRFVHYIFHPRPTPVYPRLGTHSRYRRQGYRKLLDSHDCLPDSRTADPTLASAITQSFVASLNASIARTEIPDDSHGVHEHAPNIFGRVSLASPGRRLRSYRTMKHRSIRDCTIALEMRRRARISALENDPAGRTLRRMPRIISSHACNPRVHPPYSRNHSRDEFSLPDPASTDSSRESSGSAMYVTAKSAFSEPSEECQQTILQVLDTESGVLFDKVCQGSKGTLKGDQLAPDILDEQHAIAWRFESPGRLRRNLASDNLVGMVAQPVPLLMLTLPTPILPASPVFVSHSPITVSKFITAAGSPSTPVLAGQPLRPVPFVQFCENCDLISPDSGLLCYVCEQQWLACKVWYQANDGGRRQQLKEPYIRPAESNAANRALMDFLRAPTGSGKSYGLGIRSAPEAGVSRSRFKKLAPLLAMATADSSLSVIYREEVLPMARRTMSVVDLRVLAMLPRKLRETVVDVLSFNLQLLGRLLNALTKVNLHVPGASEYLWMMTEDSMDETLLVARAARTTSRFLEHLED